MSRCLFARRSEQVGVQISFVPLMRSDFDGSMLRKPGMFHLVDARDVGSMSQNFKSLAVIAAIAVSHSKNSM
jgi:hypothetical protein